MKNKCVGGRVGGGIITFAFILNHNMTNRYGLS